MQEAYCQLKKKEDLVLSHGSINFQLRKEYADFFPVYVAVGLDSGLAGPPRHIWYRKEANIEVDAGSVSARIRLLQSMASRSRL
ncbi:hypothetical protein GUJ93_ZPchr0010g9590 [Zizania palustris]|uniref:Uncharacterized protein n=1 Tax=Zizania palustris TaxID=103762 RepID=A0A8J5TGU6_ZIZPA|nr:hypothetical protein GUJ93_ZPchr0010g9590 [Zizania palustris]